jgi:hypothetical protein
VGAHRNDADGSGRARRVDGSFQLEPRNEERILDLLERLAELGKPAPVAVDPHLPGHLAKPGRAPSERFESIEYVFELIDPLEDGSRRLRLIPERRLVRRGDEPGRFRPERLHHRRGLLGLDALGQVAN